MLGKSIEAAIRRIEIDISKHCPPSILYVKEQIIDPLKVLEVIEGLIRRGSLLES